MSSNIEISGLDPASVISPSDLLILRQGIVDRKATVSQVANINFASYAISSTPLNSNDLLLIGKNDGLGNYQSYTIEPKRIGFLAGVKMWFYQDTAPDGWQIVAGTGDRVLGTVLAGGASYQYYAHGLQGSWQQQDVSGISGQGLSIQQIPNHQHWAQFGHDVHEQTAKYMSGTEKVATVGNPRYGNNPILGVIDGAGDTSGHDSFGACDPHNHGDKFRPSALVGICCIKID